MPPVELEDAYAELGLTPRATQAQIKAAWRRLVSQWHPDRNSGREALERMQRLNVAMECIQMAGLAQGAGPEAAAGATDDGTDDDSAPTRTLCRSVPLDLEDAAPGCTREFSGEWVDPCITCSGLGLQVPAQPCPACDGEGTQPAPLWFGLFGARIGCPACRASGVSHRPCPACSGSGSQAPTRWRVAARIPPGVRHGDVLEVRGRARRGDPSAPVVHLELHIELRPHPLFTLGPQGDLHCRMPVDGFAWLAQRTVQVPVLQGLRDLVLQRGQRVHRLAGQGYPQERGGRRGDLVVELEPVFPPVLSPAQQDLLDQLADAGGAGGRDEQLAAWQQTLQRRRTAQA
jgi:molecular chaperone DnaJ